MLICPPVYKYNGSFDQHYRQEDIFTYNDAVRVSNEIIFSENATDIRNEWPTKWANKTMIPTVASETLEGMFWVNNSPNTQHIAPKPSAIDFYIFVWSEVPVDCILVE